MRTTLRIVLPIVLANALVATGWSEGETRTAYASGGSYQESEPNNSPDEANAIRGPVSILGNLPSGDQDGFLWTVSDVDAHKRWSLILDGLPEILTRLDIIRLQLADNRRDFIDQKTLLTIGSPDGARPARVDNLLIEPGRYLIALSRAGDAGKPGLSIQLDKLELEDAATRKIEGEIIILSHAYRVDIEQSEALRGIKPTRDNTEKERAQDLRLDTELGAFQDAKEGWYRVRLNEKQAKQIWSLDAQVPIGTQASMELVNDAGASLAKSTADKAGRLALPDLGLAAGTYFARVSFSQLDAGLLTMHMHETGQRTDGGEAEPNDTFKLANIVDFSQPLQARVSSKKDRDHYRFSVDADGAGKLWDLTLSSSENTNLEVCLLDQLGKPMQCRKGDQTVVLPGLHLNTGDYGLLVSRARSATEYSIERTARGRHKPVFESEPNDRLSEASAFSRKNLIKGKLSGKDTDVFRLSVDQEPQLWRFQAIGSGIQSITYYDAAGGKAAELRVKKGQRRARLSNIFLLPGVHHIAVSGTDGEYVLRALPIGVPDANAEREPNDDASAGHRLAIGQTLTGLLADPGDEDYYRFTLNGDEYLALTFTPPADGAGAMRVFWDGKATKTFVNPKKGEPLAVDGHWPAGDYQIQLSGHTICETEYRLSLERSDPFTCSADCEYNDVPSYANPLPADGRLEGSVGEGRDSDWYVIPAQPNETEIKLPQQPGLQLVLGTSSDLSKNLLKRDNPNKQLTATLKPETTHYLELRGNSTYNTSILFNPPLAHSSLGHTPLNLSIASDVERVAAHHPQGQFFSAAMNISNPGDSTMAVALTPFSSDYRYVIDIPDKQVSIAANDELHVPLSIMVAPDAEVGQPVRLGVRAETYGHRQAGDYFEVSAATDVLPLNSRQHWSIPEALLGGFNVLWSTFGAAPVADGGTNLAMLSDGLSPIGTGFELRPGQQQFNPTYRLPGEIPIPLVGVALHPQGGHNAPESLQAFEIRTSVDGTEFQTMLKAELSPLPVEQFFAFPKAMSARFIQIDFVANHTGTANTKIGLGEFKAIAQPGFAPGHSFNLADPTSGGHVTWSQPHIDQSWDRSILVDEAKNPPQIATRQASQWVIGFHHDRAAQITELQWENLPLEGKEWLHMPAVDIAISMQSPVGPWQSLGRWTLGQEKDDQFSWRFDEPVWARYVRFSVADPEKKGQSLQYPGMIRILERSTDEHYRSVLAEWGRDSRAAIHELLHPKSSSPQIAVGAFDHGTRDNPQALVPNETRRGIVRRGEREDWYFVEVQDGQNTLELTLEGTPTVGVVAELLGDDQSVIALEDIEAHPGRRVLRALVEPGGRYALKISQPPSSVIFSWDTSGSVTPYIPVIYNALSTFAEDVTPGEEWVNLLPFGGRLLSQRWLDQTYPLQSVLRNYRRNDDSSAAESTLLTATKALASRPGTKAIVLITDAATSRDPELWSALRSVQPKVFALGLSSDGALRSNPDAEQDLMQSWSAVNNADYQYITTEGALEKAFERIAHRLRRPARYTLLTALTHRDPPAPGTLRVVHDEGDSIQTSIAVELILDASGSMLQRMGGQRRINIAKAALTQLVNEDLPSKTALALRVFGHREAGSCRTDLEQPLSPLDNAAISKKIEAINAKNLAKTPIADSLMKVEQDLNKAKGRRIVVLITDGEETCDGDPAQAIRTLQNKGLDVRINIVGFAIDDNQLKQRFSHWAELGNGQYFDASDASALHAALRQATRLPYRVLGTGGETVASGFVAGAAIAVSAGNYLLEIDTGNKPLIRDLVIPPGDNVVHTLTSQP